MLLSRTTQMSQQNNHGTTPSVSVGLILSQLHHAVLGVTTGIFPGSEIDMGGQIVQLTEPANVFPILLAFLYPKAPPDIRYCSSSRL